MHDLAVKYELIIEKLISSGTVLTVSCSSINEPAGLIWYLSHFFVSSSKKQGKIRVVFDATARFQSLCYMIFS
jgi:hypothetical protein